MIAITWHLLLFILCLAALVIWLIKNERDPTDAFGLSRVVGRVFILFLIGILVLIYAGVFWW